MQNLTFEKVDREESLSHKVEKQIRNAIHQNIFVPGDKLPGEFELADKFGVSRTAIREALRMLAGRGLVEIKRGSGVYVAELDVSHVVDPFYQLLEMKCGDESFLHLIYARTFLEPEIARMAAEYRSDKDIAFLEFNCNKMGQLIDNPDNMVDLDIKFHRRLSEATSNPIIPIIMEPIFELLYKFIPSTYRQSHAPDLAIENHAKLVNCLKDKDCDGAYEVMQTHMQQAEEHVKKYYSNEV